MLPLLFLAFTLVPLVELFLLIEVGRALGTGPTLALVVITGAVGAVLARRQGFRVVRDLNAAAAEGRVPAGEMVQAVLVLAGGVALLTPGIVTDAAGLLLMVPPVRRFVAERILRRFEVRLGGPPRASDQVVDVTPPSDPPSETPPRAGP